MFPSYNCCFETLTVFRYFYLIEFVGGVVRSVKLKPEGGHSKVKSANDWKLEMRDLEDAISPCTKMLVSTGNDDTEAVDLSIKS